MNNEIRNYEKSRIKVLHIPGWYPTEEQPLMGIFVKEHMRAISLYHDVAVMYVECVEHNKKRFHGITKKVEDGIITWRFEFKKSRIPKINYFIYLWNVFRIFRKVTSDGFKPDIIHAHFFHAGFPSIFFGKIYGIPVIITEHSSLFPLNNINWIERLIAKYAFKHASYVCPVSDNLKKSIESYGIMAKFHVVPNVVDSSLFYQPSDNIQGKHGNKKRLLLVAILRPIKGIPYLFLALSELKKSRDDFILEIIGDGPNKKEYEELMESLGLKDIVEFHGEKRKHDVAKFMREADVFVLPSLWENLPCVIIEAMASGLPVIATKVGGIPEMVDKKVGILVPPKDVKALSKALDLMLDNLDSYSPIEIATYAKEMFSYEKVGKIYSELYHAALNE